MLKAYIDSGGKEEVILRKHRDPHLYTACIKYYLRELPDPLFCSSFSRQWSAANSMKDDRNRIKEIDRILDEIPKENKRNIEFLFKFLAQLIVEEVTNKMTISNLVVVLGPNLLWEQETRKQVSLEHVCRSLIEEWSTRVFMRDRSGSDGAEEVILRRGESVMEGWEPPRFEETPVERRQGAMKIRSSRHMMHNMPLLSTIADSFNSMEEQDEEEYDDMSTRSNDYGTAPVPLDVVGEDGRHLVRLSQENVDMFQNLENKQKRGLLSTGRAMSTIEQEQSVDDGFDEEPLKGKGHKKSSSVGSLKIPPIPTTAVSPATERRKSISHRISNIPMFRKKNAADESF